MLKRTLLQNYLDIFNMEMEGLMTSGFSIKAKLVDISQCKEATMWAMSSAAIIFSGTWRNVFGAIHALSSDAIVAMSLGALEELSSAAIGVESSALTMFAMS